MSVLRFGSGGPWEALVGYSRVVVRGDSAWVSGCTSVVDGEVAHPGDVAAQAHQAFANLGEALEGAGFTLGDVVRTRMYLTDMSRWEDLGRAHGDAFRDIRPATAMVGVTALLHPDMLVEVEADAVRGTTA